MKSILITVLLLLSIQSFAQKGYEKGFIILKNGLKQTGMVKTVEGFKASKSCNFILAGEKNEINYFPSEINGYRYDEGTTYESLTHEGKTVFMQVLVIGKANLYKYDEKFFAKKEGIDMFQLIKKDTTVYLKNHQGGALVHLKEYKPYLEELQYYVFADCPTIDTQIKSTKHSEESLTTLFTAYNCFFDPIAPKSKKSWSKLEFGFIGGVNSSKMRFNFPYQSDFMSVAYKRSNNLSFGLNFKYSSPRISRLASFSIQPTFNQNNYKGTSSTVKDSFGNYTVYDYEIRFSALKVPFLYQRKFNPNPNSGFYSIGFTVNQSLSNNPKKVETIYKNNKIAKVNVLLDGNYFNHTQFGFVANIGKSFGKFSPEIRYENQITSNSPRYSLNNLSYASFLSSNWAILINYAVGSSEK